MEPENNERKDSRRIVYLSIIAVALIVVSVFLFMNSDLFLNQNIDQSVDRPLADYFINEELVTQAQVLPPEELATRFKEEKAEYESIIASDSEEVNDISRYHAYLGIANLERQLGDYLKAEKAYQLMMVEFPDDYLVWHNLGVLQEEMHQYLSAAESYQISINKKSIEPMSHLKLANLYIRHSNNPDHAKEIYLKALQGTQNDLQVLKQFASYLERVEKNIPEALIYWREVDKQMPGDDIIESKIEALESKTQTNE